MQTIFRSVIQQTIAKQFPLRIVNRCIIITRSTSSQISSQKWPWTQRTTQSIKPVSSYLQIRCYSIDNDDPPEQQIPNTDRKIPKLCDTQIHFSAPPFSFLFLNFKAWKIRRYDADFSLSEFVEGSKKAVEVRLELIHFTIIQYTLTVIQLKWLLLYCCFSRSCPINWPWVTSMDCVAW